MANLSVLGFIGENTAAALYYGLERNDENVHRVIFYNLGQSGLKVTLGEFSSVKGEKKKNIEEIRILADSFTDAISGTLFD